MSIQLGQRCASFKSRIQSGEFLLGTFQKTPHMHITEVLSLSSLDTVCLDAEHAPFNRGDLDACCAIARANDLPTLERVSHNAPEAILDALDRGANGILAPHVRSEAEARALVKACQYGAGGRGFAGSTRAAWYATRGMPGQLDGAVSEVSVVAQIEDVEALDEIDQIAAVEGIDALFIGRADLTVALGETNLKAPRVIDAVETIMAACKRANRAVGMFVGDLSEVPDWRSKGASLFLLGSDHSLMLQGAADLRSKVGN